MSVKTLFNGSETMSNVAIQLVTETDELVERMIKSAVAEKYPHHKLYVRSIKCSFQIL